MEHNFKPSDRGRQLALQYASEDVTNPSHKIQKCHNITGRLAIVMKITGNWLIQLSTGTGSANTLLLLF